MKKYIKKMFSIILSMVLILGVSNTNIGHAENKNSSSTYNIMINCKTNKLGYFKNGKLVKEFPVATGKSSTPTPKGKFKIVNKIKNRPYYSGGIPGGSPNNPLGDRWLGLQVGATFGTTYAIHGNNNESSIGKYVSGGCVRMHNKDVRWLFDQVPTGTAVIIYNSTNNFVQEAKKYGIELTTDNELNSKQKKVKDDFKNFTIYGEKDNVLIDLSNKNNTIDTSTQANDILSTNSTDRSVFLNSWNALSKDEKSHGDMKKIWSEYEKIVAIVEAAQATNKFYEDVKSNTSKLLSDYEYAKQLNSDNNTSLGSRNRARKEYDEAVKYGEDSSNSKRMEDINKKYMDANYVLEISRYLENRDVESATKAMNKISDENIKLNVKNNLKNYSDIKNHWAEKNIIDAMENGWISKSNVFRPNASITRAEFVTIINNAFGFKKSATINFKDVKSGQWYYNEIQIAVGSGYISGYEDNSFKPNEAITREEAASIMTTIKGNKDSNLDKLSTYNDAHKVSNWAKSSVEGCIEAGYMGVGSKTFNPKSNITRAETIVTIERVVN